MFLHFSGRLVGVDAHIDPAERTILTEISGKFVTSQRDDVGIVPYANLAGLFFFYTHDIDGGVQKQVDELVA